MGVECKPSERSHLSTQQCLPSDVIPQIIVQNCDNNKQYIIMASKILILLLGISNLHAEKHNKGPHYKVHCTKDNLRVDVVKHEDVSDIYLQHLKDYPDPACKPEIVDSRATFDLRLTNIYQCMVTKVLNKNTGRTVYYHRVVVEYKDTT